MQTEHQRQHLHLHLCQALYCANSDANVLPTISPLDGHIKLDSENFIGENFVLIPFTDHLNFTHKSKTKAETM